MSHYVSCTLIISLMKIAGSFRPLALAIETDSLLEEIFTLMIYLQMVLHSNIGDSGHGNTAGLLCKEVV